MPSVTIHAPAKVNLALSVGAPLRPPHPHAGYHPLTSWMVCVDLVDAVTVEPSGSPAFDAGWFDDAPFPSHIDWPVEKDLSFRAASAVAEYVGKALPARITVRKRIPVGGGLGGGSADAAATLVASMDAFELSIPEDDLFAIAATLGSDVPFLTASILAARRARPSAACVSGLGEIIEPMPHIAADMVLVIPPFGCGTRAVYEEFDRLGQPGERPDRARVRGLAARASTVSIFNDLERAAIWVEPRLAEILRSVRHVSGHGGMVTGSGSTIIVVTPPGQGIQAADQVRSAGLDVAVRVARTI